MDPDTLSISNASIWLSAYTIGPKVSIIQVSEYCYVHRLMFCFSSNGKRNLEKHCRRCYL